MPLDITPEVTQRIRATAENKARNDIHKAARDLDREAFAHQFPDGDLDTATTLLDVYSGPRRALYSSFSQRRDALIESITDRVKAFPAPPLPPSPSEAKPEDFPEGPGVHASCQWHYVIPVWNLIACTVDIIKAKQRWEQDLRRRQGLVAPENQRRAQEHATECARLTQNQYDYALKLAAGWPKPLPPAPKLTAQPTFLAHEPLGIPEVDTSTHFLTGSFLQREKTDLVAVHKTGTESGHVEVDIYSGASGWTEQVGHVETTLACHDCKFLLGHYRPQTCSTEPTLAVAAQQTLEAPDLVMVKQSGTGTGSTEVHILSGQSGWQNFSLHTGTCLHETDANWDFVMGDSSQSLCSDLLAINKRGASGSVEVHALSGSSNFGQFSLHAATSLKTQEGVGYKFLTAPTAANDVANIYIARHSAPGQTDTQLAILSAQNSYQGPVEFMPSAMHAFAPGLCDVALSLQNDGQRLAMDFIKKNHTGTGEVERHTVGPGWEPAQSAGDAP